MTMSSERIITVYFDSNFYVWLAAADEQLAKRTIDALNALGVRPVVSTTLLLELMASGARRERDLLLLHRLEMFSHGFYATEPHATWLLLAGDDEVWRKMAAAADANSEHGVLGDSFAFVARRKMPKETQAAMLEANREWFTQLGMLDPQGEVQVPWDLLRQFTSAFGIDLDVEHLQANPRELQGVAERMHDKLRAMAPQLHDELLERNRLLDSAAQTDRRPWDAVTGDRSRLGKFEHTVRDAEHMNHFVSHVEQIDFLQLDGPQYNQLQRANPPHRLAQLGLAARCFTAGSLEEVVIKLEGLIESARTPGA